MSGTLEFTATLAGAVTMGLTCGTGCSPAIGIFLGSYAAEAEGNQKRTMRAVISFYGGKLSAVLFVCIGAAIAGEIIVKTGGYLGCYDLQFLMPLFLSISGIYMLYQNGLRYWKKGCSTCGQCGRRKSKVQIASPIIGGFIYGLTPCAPLIIIAGYAVTMSLGRALTLGIVFSVASSIPSLFLIMIFTKLIVAKIHQEVPVLLHYIKFLLSFGVAGIGIYMLITKTAIG